MQESPISVSPMIWLPACNWQALPIFTAEPTVPSSGRDGGSAKTLHFCSPERRLPPDSFRISHGDRIAGVVVPVIGFAAFALWPEIEVALRGDGHREPLRPPRHRRS
ncbi:hypothetical protein BHE74_00008672 [Ensete ventricosum]|nr:hypothetical protein BHE74_00008672 [Ensete ventricosum]